MGPGQQLRGRRPVGISSTEDQSADAGKPATVPEPDPDARRRAQTIIVALAVGLAGLSLGYRLITGVGWHQAAPLFVGLPAVLAIAVSRTKPARTVTGLIIKTATMVMLLAGVVVGETLICMVIASPLVYLIAVLIGVPIDRSRRARARNESQTGPLVVIAVVLLASMEGVLPGPEVPRRATVSVTRHVDARPGEVEAQLAGRPSLHDPLPAVLRIGFPHPVAASGSGLAVGNVRRITIRGDDHHGMVHTGDVVWVVAARSPGKVVFRAVRDETRIANWVTWQNAVVKWRAEGDGTAVTWAVTYDRVLTPSWYFGPVQRSAVTAAAGYLIEAMATPND